MGVDVRVVVVRERGRHEEVATWLEEPFASVAATRTVERSDDDVRRDLIPAAAGASWIVVTSSRSVVVLTRVRDVVGPATRVAAVGESTARALDAAGWRVDLVGEGGALSLADGVASPVLLVGAAHPRTELDDELTRRGVEVRRGVLYSTESVSLDARDRRLLGDADVIVLGAPSSWRVVAPFVREEAVVVVPGETTRSEVALDHERVVVGWGENWPSARELITKRFHVDPRGEFGPGG